MKGTIDHIKKWNGGYFFIAGDDGNRYWSHQKNVLNEKDQVYYEDRWLKMWDACAFKGARVNFEVSPDQNGETPVAVNVILEAKPDPQLSEKILRRETEKENRRRHEQNRIKHEQKMLSKSLEKNNLGYVVQSLVNGKWLTMYEDESAVYCLDAADGEGLIREMMKTGPGKYRLRRARLFRDLGTGRVIARTN